MVSQGGDMAQDGVVNKASAGAGSAAAPRARAGRNVSLHLRCLSYVLFKSPLILLFSLFC